MLIARATTRRDLRLALCLSLLVGSSASLLAHGTVVSPPSRVYRVYQANPSNPSFALARNAVQIDGELSYYTWNELSRNIPAAVQAGLPAGFDYSPWVPDGHLASGGRVDPFSVEYPRTYAGLDQVSADWPTTPVRAGERITVDWHATAVHAPSVWDVWMTKADWTPNSPLTWSAMEYLGRPQPSLANNHFTFDQLIPADRSGHHVLWVAWQRDDPVGEVFFSTSDLLVRPVHDECSGALELGLHAPFESSSQGATRSAEQASCEGSGGADVWFRWDAPCTGTLVAETCGTVGNFDTTLSMWSGACGSLVELACDDDSCGVRSSLRAPVLAGQRYYFKVGPGGAIATGHFELQLWYDQQSGSFTQASAGCGSLVLNASGAPNLGGYVAFDLRGTSGSAQLLMIGRSAIAASLCSPCVLGVVPEVWVDGAAIRVPLACAPELIGATFYVQGLDAVGVAGGCTFGNLSLALSPAIQTTIGS